MSWYKDITSAIFTVTVVAALILIGSGRLTYGCKDIGGIAGCYLIYWK